MRVFVTGASGWIGSAVVPELLDAGHQVTGLARSDSSAAALEAAGATVVRGDLEDLDLLRDTAAASDAVIHLAFRHDIAFTGRFADAVESDPAAIAALGEGLPAGGALTIAGGVLGLSVDGRPAIESDRPAPSHWRGAARPRPTPPWRSPSAGCGPRWSACPRRCTARVTADSSRP